MKKIIFILSHFFLLLINGFSQNVGIGTNTPIKMLSINGSLLIDQDNKNAGNVDSAALRFGTSTLIGISSNQAAAGNNPQGMDFWTNGIARMLISSTGNVGINMNIPAFRLDVNGSARTSSLQTGDINSTGNINADFSITAGIDVSANDDLFAGDDLNVTNDARVGGNMAIGTFLSSTYKLHVNGNMLVRTNVGIDGTARIDGKLTNEGKTTFLSNSTTTLRTGFNAGTFTRTLAAGNSADATFCITSFAGNNNNVRVSVAQFAPRSGASGN
jgi:hypothetical protein